MIKYKFFHWGPFLFHTKIKTEECQIILEEGKKCRIESNDHRSYLAGHLSEEYKLTDKRKMEWLETYITTYIMAYNNWRGKQQKSDKLIKTTLQSLWINYMHAGDFNPPHHHDADISFVIYPTMPKKIIEENKAFKGRRNPGGGGPGTISWVYGEDTDQCISIVSRLPETGDLFIFPATLKHWVFPFKSKVERISVSGNILKK